METFKAWLVTRDEATKQQSVAIATLTPADLKYQADFQHELGFLKKPVDVSNVMLK